MKCKICGIPTMQSTGTCAPCQLKQRMGEIPILEKEILRKGEDMAKKCTEKECTRNAVKDDLCYRHYHAKKGKKPWGKSDKKTPARLSDGRARLPVGQARDGNHPKCKAEGCAKYPWRRGYCMRHFKEIVGAIDPLLAGGHGEEIGFKSSLNSFIRDAVKKDLGRLIEAMKKVIKEYDALMR